MILRRGEDVDRRRRGVDAVVIRDGGGGGGVGVLVCGVIGEVE